MTDKLIRAEDAHDNDLIRRGDALQLVQEYETIWDRIAALPAVAPGVKPMIYTLHDRGDFGICIGGGRWHGWAMVRHPDGYWVSDHKTGQVDPTQTGRDSILAALEPAEPQADDDPECTDCGGTGTTYQTERRCACQPAKHFFAEGSNNSPTPQAEAHEEQLGVWADELMADLILNSLMDLVDHEYDTKVDARRTIIDALKAANQAKVPQPEAVEALTDGPDTIYLTEVDSEDPDFPLVWASASADSGGVPYHRERNSGAVGALVKAAAQDAREVFDGCGSKAREAIDYMEQHALAALRKEGV